MAGEKLEEHQRFALAAIVQYDLILARRLGLKRTRGEFGIAAGLGEFANKLQRERREPELEGDALENRVGTLVTNFLDAAAPQAALELRAYYETRVRDERGDFYNPPPHIRAAIDMVYPAAEEMKGSEKSGDSKRPRKAEETIRSPKPEQQDEYALESVLSQIQHRDPRLGKLLGENYDGLWDVIRYSAHEFDTGHRRSVPWVVRAAIEISRPDPSKGTKDPRFRIHYKPREAADLRISTGSIMLINRGNHLCMAGREHDTNAPIYIIADFNEASPNNFFVGLVVRRHSKGRFFASRVSFVRSKAKKIEDLQGKIDVFTEKELKRRFSKDIRDFNRCLEAANSEVLNKGKCVLLL